jgi:hypothetical protein
MSRYEDEKFKQLQLKVKFNAIPKTRLKKFNQHFNGYKNGLVRGEPGKFVMTPLYGSHAEKLYRMKPRNDDVWLLTFPKCGKYNPLIHYQFECVKVTTGTDGSVFQIVIRYNLDF